MRPCVRIVVHALVIGPLACLLVATDGHAQTSTASTAARAAAPPPTDDTSASFLAVDIFGGAHPQTSTASGPNRPDTTFGWELGSSIRPRRWFGIAANVGRVRTPERAWITHVQAGPRVTHILGHVSDLRGFAQVMVGHAWSEQKAGATDSSFELMTGAGVDVFNVFRFEVDLVRRDLDTFPKTRGRFLFGVALPLCLRGCTRDDGIDIRR